VAVPSGATEPPHGLGMILHGSLGRGVQISERIFGIYVPALGSAVQPECGFLQVFLIAVGIDQAKIILCCRISTFSGNIEFFECRGKVASLIGGHAWLDVGMGRLSEEKHYCEDSKIAHRFGPASQLCY
jgi:hypothetical protein